MIKSNSKDGMNFSTQQFPSEICYLLIKTANFATPL
jgi:hypothetical protein